MAILAAINSGGVRRPLDYYQTPALPTIALLPLIENWPRKVWDPACGDGAISKVLESRGFVVQSADLADRGFGAVQNFFDVRIPKESSLITNPPYYCAHKFILHAGKIGVDRMALLLKINFFSPQKSLPLFETWRPRIVAPLSWRIDFTGEGSPHTDIMWVLWDGVAFETSYVPLSKPNRPNRLQLKLPLLDWERQS